MAMLSEGSGPCTQTGREVGSRATLSCFCLCLSSVHSRQAVPAEQEQPPLANSCFLPEVKLEKIFLLRITLK